MPKFLYASAILPGKSELVRQIFRRQNESGTSPWDRGLSEAIGLEGWQVWLQRTSRRDYFVHSVETANFLDLFAGFQEQVEKRNPQALWVRDFYLTTLGKDFGHHSAAPHISSSLTMDLTLSTQRELYSEGYVLPLLPEKLPSYLEFCRQANGEYLYRFQEAYQRLGVGHVSYFLQRTPSQSLLIVYQKGVRLLPEHHHRMMREIREQFPACQWLYNCLTTLTGLPAEALQPETELLSQSPQFGRHEVIK